jgi:hypothetical protein
MAGEEWAAGGERRPRQVAAGGTEAAAHGGVRLAMCGGRLRHWPAHGRRGAGDWLTD